LKLQSEFIPPAPLRGVYPEVQTPRPVEVAAEQMRMWVEVLTGVERNEDGVIGALD
jgi:hypothetical protein